jgi:hypothetical protein
MISVHQNPDAELEPKGMSIPPLSIQKTGRIETTSVQPAEFLDSVVREALFGLRNGQITITVHDGEIVQIDRMLKNRPFKCRRRA